MIELNKIYNEDCLEGIKRIPDGSVGAVITDPPYCLGMTCNGQKGTFSDLAIAKPFYKQIFKEIKRVLSTTGSVYYFTDWRGYALYYPIFNEIIGAKNMLVWDKGNAPGSYYTFSHELIIFSTNKNKIDAGAGSNVIKNIHSFTSGAKKTNGAKVHPTQKPIELISKFILDSTKECETVLDCFMGSGTTAVAAIRNNRNFIGFELQEKYFDIANSRIEAEQSLNKK